MVRICIILSLLLCSIRGIAQSTNVKTLFYSTNKKADHYFDQMAYHNALHLYLHVAEKDASNKHARNRVGECYLKLADPVNAEVWLAPLVSEPDATPASIYNYAEALAMNHRYTEAKAWLQKYQVLNPEDPRPKEKIVLYDRIHQNSNDSIRFAVVNASFNSPESDYSVSYHRNGLVFSSTRPYKSLIHHTPSNAHSRTETFANLYSVDLNEFDQYTEPQLYQTGSMLTSYHDGPIHFYDSDRKAVFTRSNLQGSKGVKDEMGQIHLQIFFAEIHPTGRLHNIQPFPHNNDEYSLAHPSISNDGKILFFSSNQESGYGGSDIYYSVFSNGSWQRPVNAGPIINTLGDELFPYVSNDSTLYFSSNGHASLGGLDIVVSHFTKGFAFSPVKNFMAPLNSTYDDFAIVTDSTERTGYLASNRPGGHGLDDIYYFVSSLYSLHGQVRELSSDQTRLPGTKISLFNMQGHLIDSTRTDQHGNFAFTIPYDSKYKIRGEKDGFETLEDLEISTFEKTLVMDSLVLPLWKYKLYAKGRIFNNETQDLLTGATVKIINQRDNKVDSIIVNESGEYNFAIRPHRVYEITAYKPGFIPVKFSLDSKDLFEGDLLNDMVLEETYIEKEEVYFDYAKYSISKESMDKMVKVVRTLRKNPNTTLHIGAHADSRGTAEVNKRISQQRANATLNYFVKQGISKSRIEAVGFGEELILNRCSDGVICPEDEHSKNRRAELKVQGLTRIIQSATQ